jgi:hypothetical protein
MFAIGPTFIAVYLVPLGALIAFGLAVIAYHKRGLRRLWPAILIAFCAPWLLALEQGGLALMFEVMLNPTEWGAVTYVWVVPFVSGGLLVLGFRYWIRHIRESNRRPAQYGPRG